MVSRAALQIGSHVLTCTAESILGRAFPGFSSDQIRMDQSKPTKRPPMNTMRANKLRLVGDAKAAWRREQAEAREKAAEAAVSNGGIEAVAVMA